MIIALLFLMIFSSSIVIALYKYIDSLKWIIFTFLFWMVSMNGAFFFSGQIWYIALCFALPFLILFSKITWDFYSGKILLKDIRINIKTKLLLVLSTLSLFTLIVLSRLWINKFNGDALYYAYNISTEIRETNLISGDFQYRMPVFYHISALSNNPINMYSIAGDLLQQFIVSIIIIQAIKKYKLKTWTSIIAAFIIVAIYTVSATYSTSSLNWSVVATLFMAMISLDEEDWLWIIALPIAFSIFSLSSILVLPVSLVMIITRRNWRLKDLFYLLTLICIGSYIFFGSSLQFNSKLNILLLIFMIPMLFVPFIKKEKEFNNILYKWIDKWFEIKNFRIALAFLALIAVTILLILDIHDHYKWSGAIFDLDLFGEYTITFSLTALFAYELIKKKIINQTFKLSIAFLAVSLSYKYIVKILPKFVHGYIYDRIAYPITAIFLVIMIFEAIKYLVDIKSMKIFAICVVPMSITFGINLYSTIEIQKDLLKYNKTIAQKYSWITNKEMSVIKSNNLKDVYSDLPTFLIKDFKTIGSRVPKYRNNYFYGMIATMNRYKQKDIYNKIENHKVKEGMSIEERLKYTIEYAEIARDWSKIDKAQTFVFRNKYYAEKIMKHYSQFKNHSIEDYYVDGLYIMKK